MNLVTLLNLAGQLLQTAETQWLLLHDTMPRLLWPADVAPSCDRRPTSLSACSLSFCVAASSRCSALSCPVRLSCTDTSWLRVCARLSLCSCRELLVCDSSADLTASSCLVATSCIQQAGHSATQALIIGCSLGGSCGSHRQYCCQQRQACTYCQGCTSYSIVLRPKSKIPTCSCCTATCSRRCISRCLRPASSACICSASAACLAAC